VEKRPPFINEIFIAGARFLKQKKNKKTQFTFVFGENCFGNFGHIQAPDSPVFSAGMRSERTDHWMPADSDSDTRGFHASKRNQEIGNNETLKRK
jgi:hypothetical protein